MDSFFYLMLLSSFELRLASVDLNFSFCGMFFKGNIAYWLAVLFGSSKPVRKVSPVGSIIISDFLLSYDLCR